MGGKRSKSNLVFEALNFALLSISVFVCLDSLLSKTILQKPGLLVPPAFEDIPSVSVKAQNALMVVITIRSSVEWRMIIHHPKEMVVITEGMGSRGGKGHFDMAGTCEKWRGWECTMDERSSSTRVKLCRINEWQPSI